MAAALCAYAGDNVIAFPPPKEGMVRYVLQLPKQDDECTFKVKLIVGKTILLDERNRYFFGGKIEEKTIEGLGFSYDNVSKLGPMAGMMMVIDPNVLKVNRFITLGGEPSPIGYNSNLPIVAYAPEGGEVRYRIQSPGPERKVIEKG